MNPPALVTPEEWLVARKALLALEKNLTRAYDELARQRRALPWVKITKPYGFDSPGGKVTLAGLFAGRSQLIIQHFMFGPGWGEGCVGCSFLADHADSANQHLRHHDVSLVAVSRAPLAEIAPYKTRMGWQFPWVSSHGSDFNYDFNVSFTPEQRAAGMALSNYVYRDPEIDDISGHSVFYRDEAGEIYHTYSSFNRGDETLIGAYMYLDMTPKGRNENGPGFNLGDWVRHHDRYGAGGHVDSTTGRYHEAKTEAACCGCTTEAAS